MNVDYYDILEVSRDATQDEIKSAYRKLASKYHPDVSTDPKANEKMAMINEAYSTLKDPVKRSSYDQYGPINKEEENSYENYNPGYSYEYSNGYVYNKSAFSIGRFILTLVFLGIVFTALYRFILFGASLLSKSNKDNGYSYALYDNNSVFVDSYKGSDSLVVIPLKYNVNNKEFDVKAIGYKAFYRNKTISEIEISPKIVEIGDYAFGGCINLKTVHFNGTKEEYDQWIKGVIIGSGNSYFTNATWIFNS